MQAFPMANRHVGIGVILNLRLAQLQVSIGQKCSLGKQDWLGSLHQAIKIQKKVRIFVAAGLGFINKGIHKIIICRS